MSFPYLCDDDDNPIVTDKNWSDYLPRYDKHSSEELQALQDFEEDKAMALWMMEFSCPDDAWKSLLESGHDPSQLTRDEFGDLYHRLMYDFQRYYQDTE